MVKEASELSISNLFEELLMVSPDLPQQMELSSLLRLLKLSKLCSSKHFQQIDVVTLHHYRVSLRRRTSVNVSAPSFLYPGLVSPALNQFRICLSGNELSPTEGKQTCYHAVQEQPESAQTLVLWRLKRKKKTNAHGETVMQIVMEQIDQAETPEWTVNQFSPLNVLYVFLSLLPLSPLLPADGRSAPQLVSV